YVVDAMRSIAMQTRYDSLQIVALYGIMDDVNRADTFEYAVQAAQKATQIAVNSESKRARGIQVGLLMREMRNSDTSERFAGRIQDMIDEVASASGGLSELEVPAVPSMSNSKPVSAGVSPLSSLVVTTWEDLKAGVLNHPVAAVLTLLSVGSAFATYASGFPVLALAAMLLPLAYMVGKGLRNHHPVATF